MSMTAQEVFDAVATHLLTQNARSVTEDSPGTCLYRGPEGRKCAIGALIPDSLYRPEIENVPSNLFFDVAYRDVENVNQWTSSKDGKTTLFSPEIQLVLLRIGVRIGLDNASLCTQLQFIHDNAYVDDWPDKLREVAKRRGLSYDVVDQIRGAKQ